MRGWLGQLRRKSTMAWFVHAEKMMSKQCLKLAQQLSPVEQYQPGQQCSRSRSSGEVIASV